MITHDLLSKDTICAISTPLGQGGIGIIRMSGPQAVRISNKIFEHCSNNGSHAETGFSIRYGKIRDPESGAILDEVLVSVMRAPKTYTREDIVEINCHSGPAVLRRILKLLVSLGARIADPGEFTKRAFLNGRIDLAQAEAVMALIAAKTDLASRVAFRQLSGEFSFKINEIRSTLIRVLSEVEASIDFPDEDLEFLEKTEVLKGVRAILADLARLLDSSEKGKMLSEGIATAIVGKVNVGKSTLLNRLVEDDRAIVSPFPGTTRDVIEATVAIQGIPFRMLDTAGIRDSRDPVEQEGVKRSWRAADAADLVIMVADLSEDPDEDDFLIARRMENKKSIIVLNKADIAQKSGKNGDFAGLIDIFRPISVLNASLLHSVGLDDIRNSMAKRFFEQKGVFSESEVVTSLRHADALRSTKEALERVVEGVKGGLSEEFLCLDFRCALTALGRITGETTTEEILDQIFNSFCIGK